MSNFNLIIRQILPDEIYFLEDMLYQAIFIPEGVRNLPKEIIYNPELYCYISDFGREGDICFVAESEGELIGAAWSRLFNANSKGYGWINENTPEISMAVVEKYRNLGVGYQLLKALTDEMKSQGFESVSLSVDLANYAYPFYKKFGFIDYELTESSSLMIKNLKNSL